MKPILWNWQGGDINIGEGVNPLVNKAHCGCTSFHKYVITIRCRAQKWFYIGIIIPCKIELFWQHKRLVSHKVFEALKNLNL